MLVLTRKSSEMIRIGDNIVIKVISTGKNSVKIGIEAPQCVRVLRAELQPVGNIASDEAVAGSAPRVKDTSADEEADDLEIALHGWVAARQGA